MIESERRYFDNAKIDLIATYADYPETANNYILQIAESYIPLRFKKDFEKAKKLTIRDNNPLLIEAIKYAESVIPYDCKDDYEHAKKGI